MTKKLKEESTKKCLLEERTFKDGTKKPSHDSLPEEIVKSLVYDGLNYLCKTWSLNMSGFEKMPYAR